MPALFLLSGGTADLPSKCTYAAAFAHDKPQAPLCEVAAEVRHHLAHALAHDHSGR
jgi:hypothetical protein